MSSILLTFCALWMSFACVEHDQILKKDEEIVRVISTASHKYISNSSPSSISVVFEIATSDSNKQDTSSTRQPYELAIVLDRSGSMHGQKIEQAKLAMIGIVNNMIEGDIIHLIQYDDTVQV